MLRVVLIGLPPFFECERFGGSGDWFGSDIVLVSSVDVSDGDVFELVEVFDDSVVGRPRFGLSPSSAPSRRYAGLQSDQDLNSSLSELSIFRPTLISTVDLDGLAVTLNGPVQ